MESLRHLHFRKVWRCLGYVVMPDHVHLAIELLEGDLSAAMNDFGKFTGRRINVMLARSGRFWQPGFYDHVFRGERECVAYLDYMLGNPVRAGLVMEAEAWPHKGVLPDWPHRSASGEASYGEE